MQAPNESLQEDSHPMILNHIVCICLDFLHFVFSSYKIDHWKVRAPNRGSQEDSHGQLTIDNLLSINHYSQFTNQYSQFKIQN